MTIAANNKIRFKCATIAHRVETVMTVTPSVVYTFEGNVYHITKVERVSQ
jgi:hypothetical protein